jgi:hypothetical protein
MLAPLGVARFDTVERPGRLRSGTILNQSWAICPMAPPPEAQLIEKALGFVRY